MAAPTFSQIRAQVAAIKKKALGARVIGIRTAGRWAGGRVQRDGDQLYEIDQCDSPLAMRIALRGELAPNATRVLVTDLDERDLSEDILLRLAKRQLFPLDAWQIVKAQFQAHAIDPRLARHRWIADSLVEGAPEGGYPPASGGFLDAETAWPILLHQAVGLSPGRSDLGSILRWSVDATSVARYRSMPGDFRAAATAWLSEVAGPAAKVVLRSVEANERPDALPIGLALGVVYNPKAEGKLEKAAGKAEERYLGRETPGAEDVERWAAAATEVIRLQITDPRAKRLLLERADEILKDVGAEEYSHLSATSPRGFDQRLAEFGRRLGRIVEEGRFDAIGPLISARVEIGDHEIATRDRSRLDCLDMSIRLVRWLKEAAGRKVPAASSLIAEASYHTQEGGFVDWARLTLRRGDSVRALSEAYSQLFDRVTAIREQQAKSFAEGLRSWTEADHANPQITPVERVLEEVVAPLAAQGPVLFVVIDGMSVAVCRELLAAITGHEWVPLNRAGSIGQFSTGLAAIPSVTEISRTSLLCGALKQGASGDEQAGFASHPALKEACRGGLPPVLFHKTSLRGEDDAILAGEVRSEIGSSGRRVVGVVINAVDDHLTKGEQVGHRWDRDSIPVLAALLHEAKLSRRLAIITSDHGHVIDSNSKFSANEGGERWRTATGRPAEGEVLLAGRRVVTPESRRVIVPWTEDLRYSVKKYGYHGGVNPQEMVTPIAVLSPTEEIPEGWADAPADVPAWWEETLAAPVLTGPVRVKPLPKKQPRTGLLFELEDRPDPTPDDPQPPEPRWIGKLFASPLFEQQKKLAGRSVPADDLLRSTLVALDRRGGRMTSAAISRTLNFPAVRLRGLLAVLQRVLNIDGFPVLTRDEASDTVELNRELLRLQFDLE